MDFIAYQSSFSLGGMTAMGVIKDAYERNSYGNETGAGTDLR